MKKEYSLQIYKPNGENTDIELRKYQYNGSFMGERNITASISSPVKINWEIGDYVIFRNEPFTLRYVPPVKKQSRRGTYGEGYIYDGIVFSSIISQLMDVQFLDYVSNDNNIHYTGLSNFAFYVSNNSLTEFASRIKANIERVYGKNSWDVIVANKGVIIKDEDNNVIVEGSSFEFDDQSISITSGTSIYNAICLINTQLELNFLIRIVNGRKTIILGGSSVATAESLGYGKGRGLKSIQQSHNNNEQIVTRLHAYGSSRNLPYRYYNKKYNDKNKYPKMFDSNGNYLLESRYINKLMLPYKCWVQTSYLWDAFIQSKLADVIGIKEGEVTFDGSDEEWDEIYPSLEKQSVNDWEVGMTMYDSGYREYSETMRNRFLFNTRQMTSYGNTIEEIKKIFSLNTKNADDREQAKSILEDCKWTVTPGKEAYYEEAMKIIDEVWDGKDWEYKYDYAVQKTHKLSSTEKSNIKKYTYNGDGRLDMLPSGASIKDNGVSSDGSYTDGSTDTNGTIINTTFEVIIPQLGFDIEDWVSQDNSKATMSIKSGMCAGREFPINSCIAVDVNDYSKGWKLNLDRHQDMEVNMIFPNSVYRLDAGDEYVLTGIYMPDVYVESAENRLYNQAVKYLSDIDHTKYTYSLDVDSKWMKEHEDVANILYEGCSIVFNDFDSGDEMSGVGDLNIGEISVVATQVTISFNEEALPKYTIVLSDDKHIAVNLQEMISASVKSNTISYANSISLLEKKINDKLSKTEQDEAQELITFLKGIKTAGIENDGNNITKGLTKLYDAIMSNGFKNSMTAGRGWQIDENGNAQVESIEVRSYMRVLELVMNRLSAEESEFIFTEGGTVETAIPNEDGTYTLVMRKKTDKDITPFQEGDILKGVVNNLAEQGALGVKYYTSWVQVKEVNQTDNSIKVAVYADNDTPAKKNFPPCKLMVLHRWGNTTKKERQSCWYISSIEKRIVMLDGVTQPKLEESNYASFYGLPFDMNNFKGYDLNPNQPYLYVRGAFLQDVCFIDYLGKVVKQERYRGVWSQEVANSDDPYKVTQTTFDTVYHKNAKWQCNSTKGTKEEPSVGTTDWTMLTDGGEAITVDSTDVYYCIFSSGEYAPNDNYEGWTNAIVPTPTKEKPYLWTRTRWHFSDGTITPTYTVVRNGKDGAPGKDGRNLTKITNYYKWGTNGVDAPSEPYAPDTIPTHVEGSDYLWNYEVCSDDNGTTISQSGKTCIGYFPKDGDPGKGIRSITEYYQVGTEEKPTNGITVNSNNELDTTGWKTTMDPTTKENRFVWNQEVIQFTDGTYSISVIHLAGAQGDQGVKGDKGEDAKRIYLESELPFIAMASNGIPKDARYCFSVYARLEHLTGTVDWDVVFKSGVTEITDIPYGEEDTYRYNGNEFIIQDSEVIVSMYGVDTIIITATLGNYKAQITIPVIYDGNNGEDGNDGKNGKPLFGPTEWKTGVRYLAGKSNEAYQSLVINPKYPKQMYLCGYTHGGNNDSVEPSSTTSVTSVNSCTKTKPWVQVPYQDFVATKVLFAERGKIDNLDITNATIQGTITDMAVKTKAEWDKITNSLVPKNEKDYVESNRNFQIVDPSKAGSYFIPTIDPTNSNDSATVYERGPQIVFLPTYSPTTYDIITCKTGQTGVYKTYNIPKYQIAGTHIRITKGGAPRQYLRWAYLEDAEYDSLWNRNNGSNRNTIRDIYNLGTLICSDNKIFRVYNGNDEQTHNILGAWYYGDSDYKHGRFSVNGTVARMLWLMPGQTVELVSQIEEINRKKCLVWSVVNSSDFTAVNINTDFTKRYKSDTYSNPTEFHGESGILDPALAGNANNWEDCFMAHRKIDNLLLGGNMKEVPSLFINRNNLVHNSTNYSKDDDIMAEFYIPS